MRHIKILLVSLFVFIGLMLFASHQIFADGPLETLYINGTPIYHYNSSDPVMTPTTYVERESEFRGVWIATVYNLNIPLHTNETQYKQAYSDLLDDVENRNMNAILFQVRPMNDAFYDSVYAPWSKYLTGTQGEDPGWDVMQYLVDEAHSRGIEFHAWMNPYRVTSTGGDKTALLNALDPENFARQNPSLVIPDNDGKLILNPGEPAVKAYIRNVITELLDLYDVDGIHFDDYFYPYAGLTSDSATYDTYKLPDQTLGDWRRENVNDVIRGVKEDVDAYNLISGSDARFGVSPFGIWKSGGLDGSNTADYAMQSYVSQYADTKKWVEEGWLHYINPQVYWNFGGGPAPYADVVDWWAETVRGTGVDLIIGHGIYKTEYNVTEFYNQLKYNQKHPEIKGSVLYSAAYLNTTHMDYLETNAWTTKPLNTWAYSAVESPTYQLDGTLEGSVYRSDVTLTLSATNDVYYKIGQGDDWVLYTTPVVISEQGTQAVYIKAIDGLGDESLIQGITIEIEKQNPDVPVIAVTGEKLGSDYIVGVEVSLTANTHPIWVAINAGSEGEWQLYDGNPISINTPGSYFFRVKTIDDEDIESVTVTQMVVVIEEIYPDPILNISGTGLDPYYQDPVISISSDSPTISYKINDSEWVIYDQPFSISEEGNYTVSYRNNDALSKVLVQDIFVDQTPPEQPTLVIDGQKEGNFYIEEITVDLEKINATDIIWYRLHNGRVWSSWTIFDEALVLNINANYTLEYYAVDFAENQTEVYSELIRLDIPLSEDNMYVIRDGQIVNHYNTNIPVILPTEYQEKSSEIRAVWVATVSNIDIGMCYNEADYKLEILTMLNRLEALNFNTMFFQVRPMNDAFYDSDYAPWSRYLGGAEGVDPGWDVLEFIITEAHKRGIEFHAWMNPYRVSNGTGDKAIQLSELDDENFAKQHPEFVLQDNSGKLILNPGEPQVRAYIKNIVGEIMSKYNVDGIHFDDYFYSYNGMSDLQDEDTYNRTKEPNEVLDDWRRNNVNTLISELSTIINTWNQNQNRNVKFGISPFGIWMSGGEDGSNTSPYTLSSYTDQYADSKKWVEEGWLDYILPQLYWEFDHSSAPFADLVDWWAALCEASGVDLIIGHGFYRYTENTWTDVNEITEQLRYISTYDIIIGSSFFSYRTLNNLHTYVTQSLERISENYWTTYPSFPWMSEIIKEIGPPTVPTYNIAGISISNQVFENTASISLSSDVDIYYKIGDGQWILYTSPIEISTIGSNTIFIKSVDGLNESEVDELTSKLSIPIAQVDMNIRTDHVNL